MLLKIAEKYNIHDIQSEIDALNELKLNIGFLGEFNSGKSTIINAFLGEKILPAMMKPTTKAITEVHAVSGLEKREYFKNENDEWIPITALEFGDIAIESSDKKCKVVTPSNEFFKSDFVFIDTPGISSLDETDTVITFGYLPFLDGIILCQDINQGSLTKSVLDFLIKPEIRLILDKTLFILTKSDDKPDDTFKIKEYVVSQLEELNEKYQLGFSNIENKVIVLSAKNTLENIETDGINRLKSAIETVFYANFKILKNQRIEKNKKEIAKKLKSILDFRIQEFDFTDTELDERLEQNKRDIQKVEDIINKNKSKKEDFYQRLERKLLDIALSYQTKLTDVSTKNDNITMLTNDLEQAVQSEIKTFFPNLSECKFPLSANDIKYHIEKVEKYIIGGKMIATAILTAYIAPGATGAANAWEAIAGSAGVQVSKEAGKAVVKVAVEEVAKETFLKKALVIFGKSIKAINPAEYAGDFLQSAYLNNSLEGHLKRLARNTASNVMYGIDELIESEILVPLKNEIILMEESYKQIRLARQKSLDQAKQFKEDMILDSARLFDFTKEKA